MENTERFTLRLSSELKQSLQQMAENEGKNTSDYIRQHLERLAAEVGQFVDALDSDDTTFRKDGKELGQTEKTEKGVIIRKEAGESSNYFSASDCRVEQLACKPAYESLIGNTFHKYKLIKKSLYFTFLLNQGFHRRTSL